MKNFITMGQQNEYENMQLYTSLIVSLIQDEDVYTFFEPELPSDTIGIPRPRLTTDALKIPGERKSPWKLQPNKGGGGGKASHNRTSRSSLNLEKRSTTNHVSGSGRRPSPEFSWNVLDLKGENYFSCAVGRTRTNARYLLGSSDEVVSFLKELSLASFPS